jgi:hypothetical protein
VVLRALQPFNTATLLPCNLAVGIQCVRGRSGLSETHYVARRVLLALTSSRYLSAFGAREATICSKRGSPRSGSQKGNSLSMP